MKNLDNQNIAPERPLEVTRAVQLLAASLGIGFIKSSIAVFHKSPETSLIVGLSVLIVFFGLLSLFVFRISQGKNWARIIFLVLFLIGIPFSIPVYIREFKADFISGSITVTVALLQLAAMYLLFTKSSNAWFKKLFRQDDVSG